MIVDCYSFVLFLAAIATVPVPDSTMRYDCVTVGIVTLLLFSITLYKRLVFCYCLFGLVFILIHH